MHQLSGSGFLLRLFRNIFSLESMNFLPKCEVEWKSEGMKMSRVGYRGVHEVWKHDHVGVAVTNGSLGGVSLTHWACHLCRF